MKLVRAAAVLVLVLSFFVGVVWFIFPSIFFPSQDKHSVLVIADKYGEIAKIYYVYYQAEERKIVPFELVDEFLFTMPNFELRQVQELSVSDYLAQIEQDLLVEDKLVEHEVAMPWIVGRLIDQVIVVSLEHLSLSLTLEAEEADSLISANLKTIWQRHLLTGDDVVGNREALISWLSLHFLSWDDLQTVSFARELPLTAIGELDSARCPVAILNATGISGYAQSVAHVLESSQVRVIRMDSFPEQISQTQIAVGNPDKPECQYLAQTIASGLFKRVSWLSPQEAQALNSRYRAEIVLVLGERKNGVE